jgi:hypothetical protein
MNHPRLALLAVLFAAPFVSGQSVRSTHSGLLYFFDGYVTIGDTQLQQKFGHFPEICEGCELRTALGHAEILLTPGVILRVGENSAVRLVSNSLTDTRVEFLRGSAILEAGHEAVDSPDTLTYKNWRMRIPKEGVVRIDSDPEQVRVYSGSAEISTEGTADVVTVGRGEVLPLASVLLTEQATTPASDAFNNWALNRSSAVSEDNSIAAGITDDPDQIDTSGLALGGFSYFPATGVPLLGMTNAYGTSFWSPYQSSFGVAFLPTYPYGVYPYGALLYPGWRTGVIYPRPIGINPGTGLQSHPIGVFAPRPSIPGAVRIPSAPHVAPRVIHR